MSQVPNYLIVGSGNVAKHFKYYFDLLKIKYANCTHKDIAAQNTNIPIVLLLIKDDAIVPTLTENSKYLANKQTVHFSGKLHTDKAIGMHPLMTFNDTLYDIDTYQNMVFVVDNLGYELPYLENKCYYINPSDKAYYHSLCVLAGNFSCILWDKLFNEFSSRLGLPKTIAYPYLQQITKNIIANHKTALTGPIIRNDKQTIDANLQALANDPFHAVYTAFISTFKESK